KAAQSAVIAKSACQYVCQCCVTLDELVMLEHKCRPAPVLTQGWRLCENSEVRGTNRPDGGTNKQVQRAQQRRLTGTGEAEQNGKLTFVEINVCCPKGNYTAWIGDPDIMKAKNRRVRLSGHSSPSEIQQGLPLRFAIPIG